MAAASQAGSASQAMAASQTVFGQPLSEAARRAIRQHQRLLAEDIQGPPTGGLRANPVSMVLTEPLLTVGDLACTRSQRGATRSFARATTWLWSC